MRQPMLAQRPLLLVQFRAARGALTNWEGGLAVREMNGNHVYCADAPWFDAQQTVRTGLLALTRSDLTAIATRGHSTAIAQLFGLVMDGAILTEHLFRGLKRPLFTDGDRQADCRKLIYARKPAFDCCWVGSPLGGAVHRVNPPAGCVFVVQVSPNIRHREVYPDVDGWIDYWTWVEEDQALQGAPTDWFGRYEAKLWSKS